MCFCNFINQFFESFVGGSSFISLYPSTSCVHLWTGLTFSKFYSRFYFGQVNISNPDPQIINFNLILIVSEFSIGTATGTSARRSWSTAWCTSEKGSQTKRSRKWSRKQTQIRWLLNVLSHDKNPNRWHSNMINHDYRSRLKSSDFQIRLVMIKESFQVTFKSA